MFINHTTPTSIWCIHFYSGSYCADLHLSKPGRTILTLMPFLIAHPHCGYGIFSDWFFFVYIFLSMLSGDFLLCQTFWSKYLWIFLAIYVDYSYFDAQVRCTYLVPNMTLTLMFNRNYNNLRYSIKKIKSLLEQKFFLLKSVCEFSLKHWQ